MVYNIDLKNIPRFLILQTHRTNESWQPSPTPDTLLPEPNLTNACLKILSLTAAYEIKVYLVFFVIWWSF